MFENFPYTNFHDLNLDWIIQKLMEAYGPDNPPPIGLVLSVNGETGAVVLYREQNVQLPSLEETSWNFYRLTDNTTEGIKFTKGQPMERVDGVNRYKVYDEGNPPPGGSGAVSSVDGMTGDVKTWANSQYPTLQTPTTAPGNVWDLRRELANGDKVGIEFSFDAGTQAYKAYLKYTPSGSNIPITVELLTSAVITESGVVSINGRSGVVTLTANDIPYDNNNSVKAKIDNINTDINGLNTTTNNLNSAINTLNTTTNNLTTTTNNLTTTTNNLTTTTNNLETDITTLQNTIGIVLHGNTTSVAVSAGQYVIVEDSTISGIADGLYTAVSAWDAGFSVTSAYLSAVSKGALNDLNSKLGAPTDGYFTVSSGNYIGENRSILIGDNVLLDVWVRKTSGSYPAETWTQIGNISGHSFTNGMIFPVSSNGVTTIGRIEISATGQVNYNPGALTSATGMNPTGCRVFALIPLE